MLVNILYPIYHSKCNVKLFYYDKELIVGEYIYASSVTMLDGSIPEIHQDIFCKNCGLVGPWEMMAQTHNL